MRLFEWFCFFLDTFEPVSEPDIGYFFFDEDTGEIHSI
jgi:hypothetical protein